MADKDAVRILKESTEKDLNIYQRRTEPTLKKLIGQKKRGTYRRDEAFDDFMYVADGGAKNCAKEIGGNSKELFPNDVRRHVAQEWLDEFERDYPKGTYDHLVRK